MSFFSKEALTFLEQIRENNNKAWFETKRGEYERLILEPSRLFVTEMGEHLQALEPSIKAIPKINGSLYRIFRDIRLSKDKTPLKSRVGMIFWQGSGKRMQSASFYMHFSPDELFFSAGIRGFSTDSLAGYRAYIKNEKHAKELEGILKTLEKKGYLLPEPKYKRYPKGFSKEMPYAYLSLYANMYAYIRSTPAWLYGADLEERAFKIFEDLHPLQQWVHRLSLTFDVKNPQAKSANLSF